MKGRPDRSEAGEYFFRYIDQVTGSDICEFLKTQAREALTLLRDITEERSRHRYAPDKWSIRELAGHVNDCERLFTYRAMWFARGFTTALPSFDQDIAAAAAESDGRSWRSHVDEFEALRGATLELFTGLPPDAWMRRGMASDTEFTVRGLAYITGGHVAHHMNILRERYLLP